MEESKRKYIPLMASLYVNFIFQGMAAIILSQNLEILKEQWQVSIQEVTLVISSIGLGRVLSLYFSGFFSDRYGRKKTVQLGIISYLIFFIGIIMSQNYYQGIFFALFGGFSNAFLDTSTYPTLMEAYPNEKDNSSLSVLNKAFISLGQFVLPLITRVVINHQMYYGVVFIGCAIGLMINFFYLSTLDFPVNKDEDDKERELLGTDKSDSGTEAMFKFEGIALMLFSFTCVSTFNIFILWIPTYAERLNLMTHSDSLTLVSMYSLGSFLSVFLTAFLVKKVLSPMLVIIFCTAVSLFFLILIILFPSVIILFISSFCIGVFAAGGIWQLGLAILLELFPRGKGKITSYYSIATSVSVMIIPYITGLLEKKSIQSIFILNIFLTALGLVAALFVGYRYKKIMMKSKG